jgi:radical SAM superfamily enzyme YgiQ (UPF0313 family)
MKIYLADLGHDTVTLSSDSFPLGIGYLAAYAQAHFRPAGALDITLFREPADLKAALDASIPDLIGLSNYSWNMNLSRSFARYVKTHAPECFVVMGGPNWSIDPIEQEAELRAMPEVDCYVIGNTYEGEPAFLELLERVAAASSIEDALRAPINGCLYIDRTTGQAVRGLPVPRLRELDLIPSPYLLGLMDKFFKTGLIPKIQIARGCPFGCTFCQSAPRANNKIFRFTKDRVCAEIDYIRINATGSDIIEFADDNFGMFREDEAIADFVGDLITRYDWPKHVRTTTGKNNPERVIRVVDKMHGRLPVTASVQSMNPNTLAAIDRSNISLDTYKSVQKDLRQRGHVSYADLIIGLPHETITSLMSAVEELLASGVQHVAANQLMLLRGSLMATPQARAAQRVETKFRIVSNCHGDYGTGEIVVETEEVVVATPTFSYSDYLDFRKFHLAMTIYNFERNLEELFALASSWNVDTLTYIWALVDGLDNAPQAVRRNFEAFIYENEADLFPTADSCIAWARANYEELTTGRRGGNLLANHATIGKLFITADTVAHAADTLKRIAPAHARNAPALVDAVATYLYAVMLHVPFEVSLATVTRWESHYDVSRWVADGYQRTLSDYFYEMPQTFEAIASEDLKNTILKRLAFFGESPAGVGRLTRSWFTKDLRRQIVPAIS